MPLEPSFLPSMKLRKALSLLHNGSCSTGILNGLRRYFIETCAHYLDRRRHADRTAQLWLQKLREAPANKKLNLIYLANGLILLRCTMFCEADEDNRSGSTI